MEVYKAITSIQAELAKAGVSKEQTNTFDNYKFRGIDDVYNAMAPLLAKHGLCILPRMLSRSCEERQSQKGGALFSVTVDAEFDFVSSADGSKHIVKMFGEAMDRGDKATNKAMSAAYKYACFQAFCIPTEGDNDADATTHEVKANKSKITPTAGAFQALTKDQQEGLMRIANSVVDLWNSGDEWAAFETAEGIQDADEKVALWALLQPHSKLRNRITEMARAAKTTSKPEKEAA